MRPQRLVGTLLVVLLLGACASAPTNPARSEFEDIPVPKGLTYRAGKSTIIESPTVKAARLVYRGRLEAASLGAALRATLEANGWRHVSTTSVERGTTQVYEKAGSSLEVRVWEGWLRIFTYVELTASRAVAKVGAAGAGPQIGAWRLRGDGERDALVGLDPDHQRVRLHTRRAPAKDHVRRAVEADRDLAHALREALARAQIERHSRPPPVVHEEPERGVGLRLRVGRDALFLEVAWDGLAPREAGAVLAAQGGLPDPRGIERSDRVHDLVLLIAHGTRVEGRGRLHGDQAEELEQVVLHHVAQRPRLLVVRAAGLDADGLGDGQLDLGHVVAVPQRLEDAVGEPEHEDVLDGLLAEVVVDPVDLLLAEGGREPAAERLRARVVAPKRLLDADPREAARHRAREA